MGAFLFGAHKSIGTRLLIFILKSYDNNKMEVNVSGVLLMVVMGKECYYQAYNDLKNTAVVFAENILRKVNNAPAVWKIFMFVRAC